MLLSSIDTTLITTGVTCFVSGTLGSLALTHHKKALAWVKKVRRKDEDAAELIAPADALESLYKEQCGLARTPCYAVNFTEVTRIANMIQGRIEHTESIRTEIAKVVECAEDYVDTALPEPPAAARIPLVDVRAQMTQAMKQESARIALERAINAAQQKINTLRRV